MLRAADGIGYCNLPTPDERETNSVVFAFETSEVWAVDTWLLGTRPSDIFVAEIEHTWAERLEQYATFLRRLGLQAPYRWSAGLTGVNHRRLQVLAAPDRMITPGWPGLECLSEQIVSQGSFGGEQSPTSALLPFFEAIYHRCGMRRPGYLPK